MSTFKGLPVTAGPAGGILYREGEDKVSYNLYLYLNNSGKSSP